MVTDCSRHDVEGRKIVKLSVVSKILEIVLLPQNATYRFRN